MDTFTAILLAFLIFFAAFTLIMGGVFLANELKARKRRAMGLVDFAHQDRQRIIHDHSRN